MNKFDIQRLRNLPIEAVANRLGLTVTRHKALCPFHADRHPSLSFHVSRNSYKCFVCGAHGGVIDLAMHVLGKDFKETCQWLDGGDYQSSPFKGDTKESSFNASRYERHFQRPYLNLAARTFLFTERKLHPGVIRWCRLNSWTDRHDTPWLQIPYFDVDGQLIGVQNRRLSAKSLNHQFTNSLNPNSPRFLFPQGSRISIYNLPILKMLAEGEELWIAEGCSDCWALLSSGRKAIAIPSATLLKAEDLKPLITNSLNHKFTKSLNLHMFPDADAPGERLFQELKKTFPQLVRHPLPEGVKDYSEYHVKYINHKS